MTSSSDGGISALGSTVMSGAATGACCDAMAVSVMAGSFGPEFNVVDRSSSGIRSSFQRKPRGHDTGDDREEECEDDQCEGGPPRPVLGAGKGLLRVREDFARQGGHRPLERVGVDRL